MCICVFVLSSECTKKVHEGLWSDTWTRFMCSFTVLRSLKQQLRSDTWTGWHLLFLSTPAIADDTRHEPTRWGSTGRWHIVLSVVFLQHEQHETKKKVDFPHLYIKACFRSDTKTVWKLINFKFWGDDWASEKWLATSLVGFVIRLWLGLGKRSLKYPDKIRGPGLRGSKAIKHGGLITV